MKYTRREFLKMSGAIVAGAALGTLTAYADTKVYKPVVGFVDSRGNNVVKVEELSTEESKARGNTTEFPSLDIYIKFRSEQEEFSFKSGADPYIVKKGDTLNGLSKRIREGMKKMPHYSDEFYTEEKVFSEMLDVAGIKRDESDVQLNPDDVLYTRYAKYLNTGIWDNNLN